MYIYGWMHNIDDGVNSENRNGKEIIISIDKGSNAEKAGLMSGDIIISRNNLPVKNFFIYTNSGMEDLKSFVKYEILRNGKEIVVNVKPHSMWEDDKSFYVPYYFLILVVLSIGIFVLYKEPKHITSKLFFLFSQVFAVCLNSVLFIDDKLGLIRTSIFAFSFPFLGALLIHFFLLFPRESFSLRKIKSIMIPVYSVSFVVGAALIASVVNLQNQLNYRADFIQRTSLQAGVLWMGITLLSASLISVNNFLSTKEIIYHNQLRWVMFGVVFGLLPETIFGLFPRILWKIEIEYSNLPETIAWSFGTLILLTSISFAILRYKIWEIEIILKKGLLYSALTGVLIAGYYFIYFLTKLIVGDTSNLSHLIGLTFSVILFIPSREFLQSRIDRLFHREKYNPTFAALNFEHNLIGKYDYNSLIDEICFQLDNIFHFSSFVFMTMNNECVLNSCFKLGIKKDNGAVSFKAADDMLEKIKFGKTFAVSELKEIPELFDIVHAEVITPVKYEDKHFGCFVCGSKLSERIYSRQDIDMLNLLANRAAAILQMSILYKLELERQTLLERERLRISKDMHDEVGSSLTKIALLSDMAYKEMNNKDVTKQSIAKISSISREVVDNISEIIWAINPKNDKLDNFAAYIREYTSGFLEGTNITANFEFLENIPLINLSAEYRRNLFLVVKEALNNVVKHSGANKVVLRLNLNDHVITIAIKDNGAGFNTAQQSGFGNGLTNMQKRISEIEGDVEIKSSEGKGTEIIIHSKTG